MAARVNPSANIKSKIVARQPENAGALLRRRLALGALLLMVLASLFLHPHPEDFGNYAGAGNAVLSHGDIYGSKADAWPPFFSLLCVPLALLYDAAPRATLAGWSALNYAALLLTLSLATRMIYGRRLVLGARLRTQLDAQPNVSLGSAAVLAPLFLTLPYLIDHFEFHQINLILLALVFGGLFLDHEGHAVPGGIAIGAAAAINAMPVIFVPYLAYRRHWRAALSSAAATVVFSLSPIFAFGWARFAGYFSNWWQIATSRAAWDAAGPNQSIYAMYDRMLGHGLMPFLAHGEAGPLPMSGDPRVHVAWLVTLAATGIVTLLAFGKRPALRDRRARLAAPSLANSSWRNSSWCLLLEWSALFLIASIFSPITWKPFLVVMILPNLLLYAIWRSPDSGADARARRVSGVALIACAAMAFPTGYALAGRAVALRLETGSIVTLAVLAMLAALLWLRRRFAARPI